MKIVDQVVYQASIKYGIPARQARKLLLVEMPSLDGTGADLVCRPAMLSSLTRSRLQGLDCLAHAS